MDQDIIDYINESAQPGSTEFQLTLLRRVVEEDGLVLQLDRPLVRINTPAGGQVATIHVPTAEFVALI